MARHGDSWVVEKQLDICGLATSLDSDSPTVWIDFGIRRLRLSLLGATSPIGMQIEIVNRGDSGPVRRLQEAKSPCRQRWSIAWMHRWPESRSLVWNS